MIETEAVLTPFLRSLGDRGLNAFQGPLIIIDGSKGLRAAVRQVWSSTAVVQRCQWHTHENVVRHVPKDVQAVWRRRFQRTYQRPTYTEAKRVLGRLWQELENRNQSVAWSLAEGVEET